MYYIRYYIYVNLFIYYIVYTFIAVYDGPKLLRKDRYHGNRLPNNLT